MTDVPLEDLLAQAPWLRGLCRSLARCAHAADDLWQDAMVEALRQPPPSATNLPGWLAAVLRRQAGHARRQDRRRTLREQVRARREAFAGDGGEQRVRLHQELVQHVLALPQPYREAVLLRFFDDLPPRRIAQRLGVPTNTVRSRVQRGLSLLRQRLDGAHGGVDRWLPAIVAIGWPGGIGVLAPGSGIGAVIVMHAKSSIGIAAAAAIGLLWWLVLPSVGNDDALASLASTSPPTTAAAPRTAAADDAAERATTASTPSTGRTRAAHDNAPKTGGAPGLRGRVVDPSGRPLAAVRVAAHGRTWPRWQGGDLGWISDNEHTVFLPPKKLAALRRDDAAAAELLAETKDPAAWRTLVLSAPWPGEVLTGDDGRFEFVDAAGDRELDLLGDDVVLLAELRGEADGITLVAAPAFAVRGRTIERGGAPVVDCLVTASWSPRTALAALPGAANTVRTWSPLELRPDSDGRYTAPTLPAGVPGVSIGAVAADGRRCTMPAPASPTDDFDLVFDGLPDRIGVDGTVRDPDGAPVASAAVRFGRAETKTDRVGRFAFDALPAEDGASLTVLARGYAPLQLDGLCGRVRAQPRSGSALDLRLQPASSLRGVVVDDRDRPLAGVSVNLYDPTLLDVTFTPVEGQLGDWKRGAVTDPDGRFELGGLAQRRYRLRVFEPDTAFVFVSAPILAGSTDVVVRVPADAVHDVVRGRVRVPPGGLPPGLGVAAGYAIHIIKDGDGCMTAGIDPVPVAADGTFVLRRVPRHHAFLALSTGGITPVEAIDPGGRVELELSPPPVLEFVVRGDLGADADTVLQVVDDDGRPLPVQVLAAGRRLRAVELHPEGGLFAPCVAPPAARAVLVRRADGSSHRAPIVADSQMLRAIIAP